ncbi:MAG: phospholipase D-like domain-containing protein [Ktedonobacterales bacterium]
MADDGLRTHFHSKRAGVDGELAQRVVEFIAATKEQLDCACYDLRHPRVLEALSHLAASGKRVRIAYDGAAERTGGMSGDPRPSGTQQALEKAGLAHLATPVHENGRHLMHDKFLVRDGHTVWTGSANFTVGGLELQDNTTLEISSPELASAYAAVFANLISPDHRHESGKPALPAVQTGGARITPAFAPDSGEGIENAIIAALHGARKVRLMAFLISDPGILVALAPYASDPHFDIRGVYDPHGMQDVLRFTRQGRERFWFLHDPRFRAAPSHAFHPAAEQDFMHNKVVIVDDHVVVMGSYNFSENAEANDENVLTIESEALAAAYTTYFDQLYAAYGGAQPEAAMASHTPAAAVAAAHLQREAVVSEEVVPDEVVAEEIIGPRGHVLIVRSEGRVRSGSFYQGTVKQQFRGEAVAGQTAHFIVYTDGSANGTSAAQAVLRTAEADFAAVQGWFGGIGLPQGHDGDDQTTPRTALPVQVLMDAQAGGAYHFGCDATDLYIEPNAQEASGLMVAELVEVFEAASNNGWQCGQTNGEALSRALAVERNASLTPLIGETAQGWWASGHADYVNDNSANDTNQDANGCGTLFLYYLHSQLGHSWEQITTTGGATLGECYAKLTGKTGAEGFTDFVDHLAALAQGGQLPLPANANPFPISASGQAGPSAPPSGGQDQGIPVTVPEIPAEVRNNPTLMVLLLVVLGIVALIGALSATGVLRLP